MAEPDAGRLFSGLSDQERDRFAGAELFPLSQRMDDEEWWPAAAFRTLGANGYGVAQMLLDTQDRIPAELALWLRTTGALP